MNRAGDLLERIVAGWAILGGIVLLLIVAVTGTNVGLYVVDAIVPGAVRVISGYEDIVRLFVSAAALMMLPYCQLRRGHVTVDLLTEGLSPRVVRRLDLASLGLMTALPLFLGYWMIFGMLETRADGRISPVLEWAQWPFYLPGLVSLALWALVALDQLRRAWRESPA
ncbi:MAG: TRAP transporter small permease [Geminicoccaceae bacterium]